VSRLPTLFLSHGSPMHALDPGAVGAMWRRLGSTLPRPSAILIASAHWETSVPTLTGSGQPETIHDFYNFPAPLYEIRYPAPGAPELATRARELLARAGFSAEVDTERGLDHGAWSPLLHAYPDAAVPVVQLSLQAGQGPGHHLRLGYALEPLTRENVLLIGSGHMTHNLRDWSRGTDGAPLAYVREFQSWIAERLATDDRGALVAYRSRAPHAMRAHPSEEHFLPLFVALGASGAQAEAERLYDTIEDRALAMDAFLFHPVH
jgi:4,5-DOPA dioxygenase extradiol